MLISVLQSAIALIVQWEVLLGIFVLESIIRAIAHPKDAVEQVDAEEKTNIISRANRLHSRALSLIALVVAGVSIILSRDSSQQSAIPGLTLLALSASFLMLSHQSKNLVRGRRIWSQFQERTMEYGALSLFAALILLYKHYSTASVGTTLLQGAFIVVILIRLNAVQKLARSDYRKWRKQEGSSRFIWTGKKLIRYLRSYSN